MVYFLESNLALLARRLIISEFFPNNVIRQIHDVFVPGGLLKPENAPSRKKLTLQCHLRQQGWT